MSIAPLTSVAVPSLASALDGLLAGALTGHEQRCLWCGAPALIVRHADIWSGSVSVHCRSCGSELSGVVPRRQRGVRR